MTSSVLWLGSLKQTDLQQHQAHQRECQLHLQYQLAKAQATAKQASAHEMSQQSQPGPISPIELVMSA